MIFISEHAGIFLIHRHPVRFMMKQYPGLQLMRTFSQVQDAIAWCAKSHLITRNLTGKVHTGITPDGRERMRERKRGRNNPNAAGLSMMHRNKISLALRRIRQKHLHPMWNRQHRTSSRMKTSITMMSLPKRIWWLDEHNQEHLRFLTEQVPVGWHRGRKRGQAGRYIKP